MVQQVNCLLPKPSMRVCVCIPSSPVKTQGKMQEVPIILALGGGDRSITGACLVSYPRQIGEAQDLVVGLTSKTKIEKNT